MTRSACLVAVLMVRLMIWPASAQTLAGEALVKALRQGGHVLVMWDRGSGTPEEGFTNFVYQPWRDSDDVVYGTMAHVVDVTELVRARRLAEAHADESKRLTVDPVEICEAAIDAMQPQIAARHIAIHKTFGDSAGLIPGDAARLQQGMCNLLSNAIEFSPDGDWSRCSCDEKVRKDRIRMLASGFQVHVPIRDQRPGKAPRTCRPTVLLTPAGKSLPFTLSEREPWTEQARAAGINVG